jgi:hypothetical protein
MPIRVPQNQIVTSKYTAGKEYIFNDTYREYIGYYYELNNKFFAGKEFNTNSPELIRMNSDSINRLLTNPFTYLYGKISKIKLNNNKFTPIYFLPSEDEAKKGQVLRYFAQKINFNPILIKEIDKETYNKLVSDPLYITVSIINYIVGDALDDNNNYIFDVDSLDKAEKQMPGIKAFLNL